jgi:hypothetical protein
MGEESLRLLRQRAARIAVPRDGSPLTRLALLRNFSKSYAAIPGPYGRPVSWHQHQMTVAPDQAAAEGFGKLRQKMRFGIVL